MKKSIIFPLILCWLTSCTQTSFSFAELQKASWDSLDKGIEFINVNTSLNSSDTIVFSLVGITGDNTARLQEAYKEITAKVTEGLGELVKIRLPNSKKGYLRVNLYTLFQPEPEPSIATVWLEDGYDTLQLKKDIKMISKFPGVRSVDFVSKEMTKKTLLEPDSSNWSKVLDLNPIPSSIQITLDAEKISSSNFEVLKKYINDHMVRVSDISFPRSMLESFKEVYVYVQYSR